jgi:hypothetical protein
MDIHKLSENPECCHLREVASGDYELVGWLSPFISSTCAISSNVLSANVEKVQFRT